MSLPCHLPPSLSLWPSVLREGPQLDGQPTKDSLVFAAFTLATSFCTQVTSPFLTARIRSCSRPILITGSGSGLQSPGRSKGLAQSSVSSPCLNALEDSWSWGNKSGVSGNGLLVRQRYSSLKVLWELPPQAGKPVPGGVEAMWKSGPVSACSFRQPWNGLGLGPPIFLG